MRILTSLLLALVLAGGLAIAGYAASWSLRRTPLADVARPAPTAAAPIAPPQRLPDSADFGRRMAPPPARGDAAMAPLGVVVLGIPTGWPAPQAGIAIAPRRGEGIAWYPLQDAERRDGAPWIRHACPVGDEVVVALAAERTGALHTYLARTTVRLEGAATIELDARATAVVLRLPAGADRSGPFLLQRRGDAGWMPATTTAALLLRRDAPTELWLGFGDYRLADALQPDATQDFAVPSADDVVVNATLARVRAARQ